MVAGTSTGSILASALVLPSQKDKTKNAYYASDIIKLYELDGPEIFKKVGMNKGLLGTIIFFSIIIGSVLGYNLGVKIYSNP
jgi:patatin-like phospholipase/acyl hydrolase